MEVLLLGATGLLGRALTAELTQRGHHVRAASRRQRPAGEQQVRWIRVDLKTGDEVAQAVDGVDVVIDAANVRTLRRSALDAVLVEGTARVLEACHRHGDIHYVGISIVGIEQVPYRYYRAKLRQEELIHRALVPWSLVRATQFHQLVDQLLSTAARPPVMVLPTTIKVQPIDVTDVARVLAGAAERPAASRLPDIGGPRVHTLGELAQQWMRARQRRKRLVRLPLPRSVAQPLQAGALCTPNAVEGRDFATWLASTPGRDPMP